MQLLTTRSGKTVSMLGHGDGSVKTVGVQSDQWSVAGCQLSVEALFCSGTKCWMRAAFGFAAHRLLPTDFMHRITLIPGDGIGPEVASAVVRIIEASGAQIEWETHLAGQQALDKSGKTLPDELIESIKRNKVGLKGPITTPVGKGFTSVNVGLRKALDLYANLRPIRALPNIPCRNPNLDLVVVRENTESLYSGLEHEIIPGVVESLKIITEKASTHIAHFAFDYAVRENRKKITCVHKANIMKLSDGLFLKCFHKVGDTHPEIEAQDMIVDNASMQLVMRPEQFDILLCENLYGDIVSDLCAGLIGGLGLVPGANIGDSGAVFET